MGQDTVLLGGLGFLLAGVWFGFAGAAAKLPAVRAHQEGWHLRACGPDYRHCHFGY